MYLLMLGAKLTGSSTVESSGLLSKPQRLRLPTQTVPIKTISEVLRVANDIPHEARVERVEENPK